MDVFFVSACHQYLSCFELGIPQCTGNYRELTVDVVLNFVSAAYTAKRLLRSMICHKTLDKWAAREC